MADVKASEYTVSVLPEDDINHGAYAVKVAYRGRGLWAVLHHGFCLGADGTWDYEMSPSSREDDWLSSHRFDEQEALRLATEAAPLVEVNGRTAVQALERTRGRTL